jgi:hypothetical protein
MFTSKCITLFLLYLPSWLQITAKKYISMIYDSKQTHGLQGVAKHNI